MITIKYIGPGVIRGDHNKEELTLQYGVQIDVQGPLSEWLEDLKNDGLLTQVDPVENF